MGTAIYFIAVGGLESGWHKPLARKELDQLFFAVLTWW